MNPDGANMAAEGAQPRPIGAVVRNRYKILSVVGRGGLGVVYRVSDILYSSNNVFALKELSDPAPGARQQFELESRWLQALDHNNIPRVRESFEWDGRSYLVMDFVDGENLEQYLRRLGRPLPEDQALRWMLPICDALQYLHTRTPPLLHRDVKPANIIVTPGGHPVLVDFGIAKAHLPGMNQTLTFVRKAGTEGYAPPEQYAATGMTGPWSDVYALGATLYQLLTGRVPQTAVERITGVSPMPHPRSLNSAITPGTDAAIMRALELKPANRYQSVTEFAAQMMEALQLSRFASSGPDVAPLASAASQPLQSVSPTMPSPPLPPGPNSGGRLGGQAPSLPPPSVGPASPFSPSVPPRSPAPRSPAAPVSASLPPLGNPIPSNLPGIGSGGAVGSVGHGMMSGPLAAPSAPRMVYSASSASPAGQADAPARALATAGLSARTEGRPAETKATKETKRTRRGPPLAVLIGVLVVLIVVVSGLAVEAYNNFAPPDRSTPQASVNGYFDALEQQNYARAWLFSSASRNDPNSQSSLTAALSSDDARYGRVLGYSITQTQSDNAGHTDFTISVTRSAAPSTPLTYDVTVTEYSGPLWLIDSASNQ